ncbi:MAG: glucose-6-phosphate isomerase [Holosporales bacterium]
MIPYKHAIDEIVAADDQKTFASYLDQAVSAAETLKAEYEAGTYPSLLAVHKSTDIEQLQLIADRLAATVTDVVVLGTGGSSLGGQTLAALKQNAFMTAPGRPRLSFADNVDPHTLGIMLAQLMPEKTGFVIISKSGNTVETMAQAMVVFTWMKAALSAEAIKARVVVLTEPKDSALMRLAQTMGVDPLHHHPGIGGRYSVFSNVGALPALIAGVDMARVRRGSARVLSSCFETNTPQESAPIIGAALHAFLAAHRGCAQAVMMPYVDRLFHFAFWFRQLWAESLGKQGRGTTPIDAFGTVDQHSQLQLYNEGPKDKFFTVFSTQTWGKGAVMDADLASSLNLEPLAGRTLGDLLAAECQATTETLRRNGCPVRTFHMEELDEESLGALLMHFMLETMLTAKLWQVNAFDQPAVEESKVLTRQYLAASRR